MLLKFVEPGSTVKCGQTLAKYIGLSGADALVELRNGSRVIWSCDTEVETAVGETKLQVDRLPALKAALAYYEGYTQGKYAPLGIVAETPCTPLPLVLHPVFVTAAIGVQPEDAVICRRCTDKFCVNASHLFWGTRSDCQRDMVLRGLAKPRGKLVSVVEIATKIIALRRRIASLEGRDR